MAQNGRGGSSDGDGKGGGDSSDSDNDDEDEDYDPADDVDYDSKSKEEEEEPDVVGLKAKPTLDPPLGKPLKDAIIWSQALTKGQQWWYPTLSPLSSLSIVSKDWREPIVFLFFLSSSLLA